MWTKCSDVPWDNWSMCLDGSQYRERDIERAGGCNNDDHVPLRETRSCVPVQLPSCSEFPWGEWKSFGNSEYRTRLVNPVLCIDNGTYSEQRSKSADLYPNYVSCSSFPWTEWSQCDNGKQRRNRITTSPCGGEISQIKDCDISPPSSNPIYTPSPSNQPSNPIYTPPPSPSNPIYTPPPSPSNPIYTPPPSNPPSNPIYTPSNQPSNPIYTPPSNQPSNPIYTPPSNQPSNPIYTPPPSQNTSSEEKLSLPVRILIFLSVCIVLMGIAYGQYSYYYHKYLGYSIHRKKYKYGFVSLWIVLVLITSILYYVNRDKLLFF
jgi:hypothetical protein